MIRNAFIVCTCLLAMSFHYAHAEDDLEKATDLMRRKLYDQATPVLTRMIVADPQNARARFQLGVCFLSLEKYRRAYEAFITAAEIKPDHRFLAGEKYRQAGMEKLNMGQLTKVEHLFRKAVEFQPHLNTKIAQSCHSRAVEYLKRKDLNRAGSLFKLAGELEPAINPFTLKAVIKAGDAADDVSCIGYYNLASGYCGRECPEGRNAGLRLKRIADRIEDANVLDPDIDMYREIGRKFIYIPPGTEVCEPGKHVYSLKPGERTSWLTFPTGIRISFEIQASGNNFEAVLGDGSIVRYWKNEKLPEIDRLPDTRIKFRALREAIVIGMIVNEIP